MKNFLACIFMLVIGYSVFTIWNTLQTETTRFQIQPTVTNTPTPTPYVFSKATLWSLIQNWKTDNGFEPYIEDQRLCEIATDRLDDKRFDNHQGFFDKYSNYPYPLAENVGGDYQTETKLLQEWIASPTHLVNLERPLKASCLECEDTYCVHIMSSLDY